MPSCRPTTKAGPGAKQKKIGAFRTACKLLGHNATYDATRGRIWLNLGLQPYGKGGRFVAVAGQYDPIADRLYSWNGKTRLGSLPGEDALMAHGRVEGQAVREILLHKGVLYMLLQRKDTAFSFARWDGQSLRKHDIPAEKTAGCRFGGPIWTTDGKNVTFYGMRKDVRQPSSSRGTDVHAWTSTDGGKTWDDGRALVRQDELGVRLQQLNRVMNYSGDGPFLVISEATGQYPDDFKVTLSNQYDNPWRKNKRLYALDEQGRVLDGTGK